MEIIISDSARIAGKVAAERHLRKYEDTFNNVWRDYDSRINELDEKRRAELERKYQAAAARYEHISGMFQKALKELDKVPTVEQLKKMVKNYPPHGTEDKRADRINLHQFALKYLIAVENHLNPDSRQRNPFSR